MNDTEFIAAMQRGIPPIAPPSDPAHTGTEEIRIAEPQRAPAPGGR